MSLRTGYLLLAVLGLALPYAWFVPWLLQNGLDFRAFVEALFVNRISGFFATDVIVSAVVVILFVRTEGRRLDSKTTWAPLVGTALVGVSFGLPLFLYLRERDASSNATGRNRAIEADRLFDHVKFGVGDYAASKAFFLQALAPLGIVVRSEGTPAYGVELSVGGKESLCLFQTAERPAPLHLAFAAATRRQVDAFHRAALEAGARDHGAPGLRPQYHANYYAAFVIGPDGHNIEVVCSEPGDRAAVDGNGAR